MNDNGEKLEGTLERIVFFSEDNNYTVARLRAKGHRELVTVVGSLAGVSVGETISAQGAWVNHKRFGLQFRADSFITQVPATLKGIERYLGSGLIKGVGPVTARRIIARFGLETLDVIEKAPRRLAEVEGLGAKRVETIIDAWEKQKGIRDVMVFLQGYDISATFAEKIYRVYGGSAISRVKEDPYCLAADIIGIGFKKADKVARSMDIPIDSPKRARAGIIYLLSEAAGEGHLFLPSQELLDTAQDKLEIDRAITEGAVLSLEMEKRIRMERAFPGEKSVYLPTNYTAEKSSAERLRALAEEGAQLPLLDVSPILKELEKRYGLQYTRDQEEAVRETLAKGVLIITGGPGTGKTTLIRAVVTLFKNLKLKMLLTAPTGRAAKRLSDATGAPARTIHRLLEYNPRRGGFQRDESNPLQADAVIVDETSMLDIPLFHHLIQAVSPGTRLILVGDMDQLPSVGPGNFLRDAINAGVFRVVVLKEIFRQAGESMIVRNAHRINQGEGPEYRKGERGSGDFFFIRKENTGQVLTQIKELCSRRLPQRYGFDRMEDIQVICPMNRGEVGTWNLNLELQKTLNPRGAEITRGGSLFRMGDRVMQVRNNYDKNVYNGDLGRVTGVRREEKELLVNFDGQEQELEYNSDELDELTLAYAMSVHKSQGSEYPAVVIPMVTQHFPLLQRNLLYTAVSRARKLVVLVGDTKAMYIAINNDRVQERYTHFTERLSEGTN